MCGNNFPENREISEPQSCLATKIQPFDLFFEETDFSQKPVTFLNSMDFNFMRTFVVD